MIAPSVADKGTSRPSSGKSDSSKSPVTSSDEGDSEYISYSDGSSEGTYSIFDSTANLLEGVMLIGRYHYVYIIIMKCT